MNFVEKTLNYETYYDDLKNDIDAAIDKLGGSGSLYNLVKKLTKDRKWAVLGFLEGFYLSE